jgi:hypothetical protein
VKVEQRLQERNLSLAQSLAALDLLSELGHLHRVREADQRAHPSSP